jgi:hypothetical protein
MNSGAIPNLVLRHSPGRIVATLVAVFGLVIFFGLTVTFDLAGEGFRWSDALLGLLVVSFGYFGIMLAVQSFLGTPLLQASEAGISFYNPSSSMFIRWSDVVEFRPVNFRCLQIRLRDGAQPVESNWMRVLGASILASPQGTPFWASRKSVVVQMFTTVPRPGDVARALTEIQARRLAG